MTTPRPQPQTTNPTQTTGGSGTNQVQNDRSSNEQNIILTPSVDAIMKTDPGFNRDNVKRYFPLLAAAMSKEGLISRNQVIALLATVSAETGTFAPIKEAGRRFRYDPYRGRGFIQITWRDAYAAAGKYLGIGNKLVENPDLAMEPELSARIFVWSWHVYHKTSKYAEKGDWDNVRSTINRGIPNKIHETTQSGTIKFRRIIKNALEHIKEGIPEGYAGGIPSNYGAGDEDSSSNTTISGLNPSSQADALAYAIGIHDLDMRRSHQLSATLDISSQPDILDIDAGLSFGVRGFGEQLDGEYVCDEIIYFFGPRMEAEVTAYKPDPDAPPISTFRQDANGEAIAGDIQAAAQIQGGDGSIPSRIYQAGIAAKGKNTSHTPDRGKNGCAHALNEFCIVPAGLKMLGAPVAPWGHPVAVAACEEVLKNGRGRLVSREEAVKGDIWVMSRKHIGICSDDKCATVLSNSSSRARFSWDDKIDTVNSWYGGQKEKIYRVLN